MDQCKRLSLAKAAWISVLSLLTATLLAAGFLSLPLGLQVAERLQWLSRGILVLGLVVGAIGPVTGHTLLELSNRLRKRLEVASLAWQGAIISGCACLVAVPMIALIPQEDAAPTATAPKYEDVFLGDSAKPRDVQVTGTGDVWLTDSRRNTLTFISPDAQPREIVIPRGKEASSLSAGESSSGIIALATDVEGNAWALNRFPEGRLTGVSKSGHIIAQYPVPEAESMVVDESNVAWLVKGEFGEAGASLTRIDVVSGAQKAITVFPGVQVSGAQLWTSASQGTWLLVHGHDNEPRVGSVSADGTVTEHPVHWPKDLLFVFAMLSEPIMVVDAHGTLWFPYFGGIARISGDGTVTNFELYTNCFVNSLESLPDGRIAFSFSLGRLWSPFDEPISETGYAAIFDPDSMDIFPRIKRIPTTQPVVAVDPGGKLVVPVPEMHQIRYVDLSPPGIDIDSDLSTEIIAEIDRFHVRENALMPIFKDREVGEGIHQLRDLYREYTANLKALVDKAPTSINPVLKARVKLFMDGESARELAFSEFMPYVDSKPQPKGFFIKLSELQEEFRAELNELRLMVGASPTTPNGEPHWTSAIQ